MSGCDGDLAGAVELLVTALVVSAAAWSGWQVASAPAAAVAGGAGLLLSLGAFSWAARGGRQFLLPRFALPAFPATEEQIESTSANVVVFLHPGRRLPALGERDGGDAASAREGQRSAEVIPLRTDASAALRDALVGLRDARR